MDKFIGILLILGLFSITATLLYIGITYNTFGDKISVKRILKTFGSFLIGGVFLILFETVLVLIFNKYF